MAATNYTPISLYYSSTTTNVPTNTNLVNGELAINITDGKLFYKDNAGVVQVIATKDASTGNFTTVDTTNLEVTNVKAKDGTAAATIADSTGAITVSSLLNIDNLRLDGNTISSTDTNGNIVIAPNGSGRVQVSGTSSNSSGIELFEDTDNGTNKVLLTVPADIASDATATLPATTTTLAGLAVAQTFSVSQRGTVTTDNDGSFDMNATNNFLCTPTAGFALTFTNITAGQSGNIILVNGSNYAITAAAATKVASTTLATISATGTYWLSYYSPDGTNVYVANTGALA